jgi:P27 family predicted phage terminase small subunit
LPYATKALHGTARGPPPRLVRGVFAEPEAPADLSPAALVIWQTLAPELVRMKTLAEIDTGVLRTHCEAEVERRIAEEHLTKEGHVVTAPSGYPVQSPWLSVRNKAVDRLTKTADRLGLSAGARAALQVQPPKPSVAREARRRQRAAHEAAVTRWEAGEGPQPVGAYSEEQIYSGSQRPKPGVDDEVRKAWDAWYVDRGLKVEEMPPPPPEPDPFFPQDDDDDDEDDGFAPGWRDLVG